MASLSKKSKGKVKLFETHLKQNYVDEDDLEKFMDDNFHGTVYKWKVFTPFCTRCLD